MDNMKSRVTEEMSIIENDNNSRLNFASYMDTLKDDSHL